MSGSTRGGRSGDRPPHGPHGAPDPTWPAVGQAVLLAAPGDATWEGAGRRTRVEDAGADGLAVLVPPAGRGELEPPADGSPMQLRWTGARGQLHLPVVLRERVRARVPLWWLQPTGPVERHQRRSYVRAAAVSDLPPRVELAWQLPAPGRAGGDLLDLSEGGLRALVGPLGCPEGAAVALRLTLVDLVSAGPGAGPGGHAGPGSAGSGGLDGGVDVDAPPGALEVVEHELFGTVLRAGALPEAAPGAPGSVEVVVQLHEDRAQGEVLRRLVFAWERRARRR